MPTNYRFGLVACVAIWLFGCSTTQTRPVDPAAQNGSRANSVTGILFRAISLVGTPYRYGGNTPQGGFDCSGLVDYVFQDALGIALPHSTTELEALDLPSVSEQRLEGGDLLFFHNGRQRVSHVGIYVGERRFVHAPNVGGTVRLDSLDDGYWRIHYSGAKRVAF